MAKALLQCKALSYTTSDKFPTLKYIVVWSHEAKQHELDITST